MGEEASSEAVAYKRGRGLLSRWKLLVMVPSTAAAIAFLAASALGPHYRGEARLLLDIKGEAAADTVIAGQAEIISSVALLNKAAQNLDFGRSLSSEKEGWAERMRSLLGMGGKPGETPQARGIATLKEGIEVVPAGARMLTVRMSSADAKLAAAAPNALVDAYLALLDTARLEPGRSAVALDPALAALADAVRIADGKLAQAVSAGSGLKDQLALVERKLAQARKAREAVDAAVVALESVGRGGVSSDGLPDHPVADSLRSLIERRAEARARVDELSRTLLDNHPDMRAAKADLSLADGSLRSAAAEARAALRAEAMEHQSDEERLSEERGHLAEQGRELDALSAASAEAHARFDKELARYHPAAARYLPSNARLIARAQVPEQSYAGQPISVSLVVFAVTLLILVLATLVQNRLQRTAERRALRQAASPIDEIAMPAPLAPVADVDHDPADDSGAEATIEAPVLPEIAARESSQPIVLPVRLGKTWFAGAAAGRRGAEGLSRLPKAKKSFLLQGGRAPMQHADHMTRMGELDAETMARRLISGTSTRAIFVSPEGDEAAAVAILTARAIADAGLRVLLLDLTASGAASRPMLEQASLAGITDLLVREAQFTDAIHQDHFSDCHVIPVGKADPNRAMRAADRLPVIIDSLTAAYDIVVVECGPADAESIRGLVSDDAEVIVSLLDADEDVARAADDLIAAGHAGTRVVAPGSRDHLSTFSREAIRDRWLADTGAEI